MSTATCPECGDQFHKDQPWKTICTSCWKESKRAEHAELLELREEVSELRLAIAEMKAAVIQPDMLSRLIRLCHPDKHGNSEVANVATAFLLAQRTART